VEARYVTGARDVLLIPCWRRPEFLWHCLDNLSRAEGVRELHLLFRADTGYDRALRSVIEEFSSHFASYQIDEPVACPYRRTKQSANVLGGYLLAAALTRRYVFMVEEDVIVAHDFLRWHYAVQALEPRLFCSIGTRNTNREVPESADPQIYYLTAGDYCSLGVCFESSVITQLLAPHVTRSYFADPGAYCAAHFPGSRVGPAYVEQDGLIRRIQEREGEAHPIAYPYRPRAYHAGYVGYHRRGSLNGTLRERIRLVGDVIYDVDAMRTAAGDPSFVRDSIPVPLNTPPWDSVRHQALPAGAEMPA
jgi:hypothetical protein